nr:unnamed protein product [Naegleria fowleri]
MIFSRSIASPWHKIVELQRLQELYKSFIPAHVLLQIEAENGDEDDYMKIEDDVPKEEDVKSKDPSHTSASNSTLQSSTRYNSNKIDLASKFSLYLEKKKVSMIQVKFQGLEWILDNGTPIEIIEILKDIFEKIQFSTRSTSSLMEHVDDDSVSIVFNASRDQSRHEEKAIKTCMDLSDKLRELQNAKWMHSDKSHSILAANHIVFRFAIHVQHCLCGNVGTADIRSFKILGSIYENISNLTNHASQMHLRIVCDETISKISQSLYHTRFVGFTNFVDEVNTYKSSNVYEIGAPLSVSDDEWLYELANKQKNEEWNDYNMACKAFFATNFGLALLGFEKYEQGHSHDLPTKHMIQLCKKELHQGSYFVASDL